jgi:hypothetical protein
MLKLIRITIPSTVAIPKLAQQAKSVKTRSITMASLNRIETIRKVTFGLPDQGVPPGGLRVL